MLAKWIWVLWPIGIGAQLLTIVYAVCESHRPLRRPRIPSLPRPPRPPRRPPEIELESWSQPWPCPHRSGWSLAWNLTSHGPSAEDVRANARCDVCGELVFDDPERAVPDHFPSTR